MIHHPIFMKIYTPTLFLNFIDIFHSKCWQNQIRECMIICIISWWVYGIYWKCQGHEISCGVQCLSLTWFVLTRCFFFKDIIKIEEHFTPVLFTHHYHTQKSVRLIYSFIKKNNVRVFTPTIPYVLQTWWRDLFLININILKFYLIIWQDQSTQKLEKYYFRKILFFWQDQST